ncbi:L-threonylcarbamoyladenylate synthase [Oceanibaculum pacificum]|uniref:Threonylcarbamoyl-AMP synthase n=1 Tax=Oceanibaculum pacificum TaxID=580166 RepID=A0A154VAF9_9PROT|nr:L-threonylcarbamoyladenylate synthase [Oceanibaculum pacificum]KZC98345.1 translation factor Sua5 [Oceanibaculum pacificum]
MSNSASLPHPATDAAIAAAAAHLRAGRLVAFPTETVYGLGGDATDDKAVAAIFAAKGRPSFNPLISHLPDAASARALAVFTPIAEKLAAAFWPGPLTLVLKRRADCPVSHLACAGLETIALRVPAHPVAAKLLRAVGRPVVAPSANPSGRVSPTTARHVADGLGDRLALVLDGGPCAIGVESTVVDATGARAVLLRPGGVTLEVLEQAVGTVILPSEDPAAPTSPGQLASHYAPALPVRLNATHVAPGEALLAFGPALAGTAETLNLSPSGDLQEAAANLFALLRSLDKPGRTGIAVMPIPETGLGRAINDRLRRAAAPR